MMDGRSRGAPIAANAAKTHPTGRSIWPLASSALARIAALGLLALVLLPVIYLVLGSLRTGAPTDPAATFTLRNWEIAFGSPDYLRALLNTLLLSATVAALATPLGAFLAWILSRTDAPGAGALSILVLLPMMISNLITSLAWIALAAPNAGFVNAYARAWFGLRVVFDIYSFQGIVLVDVLHYASFAFVSCYAALSAVDSSLEEASSMQGAGPIETAFRITLPLTLPAVATSALLIFVFVAENFSVPTLLGAPIGFQTLPSIIYLDMSLSPAEPNLAAAAAMVLLIVAGAGALWHAWLSRGAARFVTVGGKGAGRRLVRLGRGRWLASLFVASFLIFAVALPYAVLALGSLMSFLTPRLRLSLFTLDNYRALFVGENLRPAINSMLLSVFGGMGAAAIYGALALALRRLPGAWKPALAVATMIPTATPALALAVGLIWLFVGSPLPIYGTAAILIIAYVIRFIGYGLRQASQAFGQIAPDLSEAARVSGASPARANRDIVMPLARRSLLALWTALFISIFTEISATIMLYAPATRTLPTVLWEDMGSGSQPRAFAIAVAQATLILLVLFVADRRLGVLRDATKS
jgi:iron(III) transport system permease protein